MADNPYTGAAQLAPRPAPRLVQDIKGSYGTAVCYQSVLAAHAA